MTNERAKQLADTFRNWLNGVTLPGEAILTEAQRLESVKAKSNEVETALKDGSISGILKIQLENNFKAVINKLSGTAKPAAPTPIYYSGLGIAAAKLPVADTSAIAEPTFNPTIPSNTTTTDIAPVAQETTMINYEAVARDAFKQVMNKEPGSAELAIISGYAKRYSEKFSGINWDRLKNELISKITAAKAKNTPVLLGGFITDLMTVLSDTPATVTLPGGVTLPIQQPVYTDTGITVTDNPLDYAPVIPSGSSPSSTLPAVTTSSETTEAISEVQTMLAGIGSNIWMILLVVGVFVGMLFLRKGKK